MTTSTQPLTIELTERIHAPIERVWRFIGTEAGMRTWQSAHAFEAVVGGKALFYLDDQARRAAPEAARYEMTGEVLELDPPRRLAYTWRQNDLKEGWAWPAATLIEIDLEEVGPSETLVRVRHSGFEKLGEIGQRFRDGYERGWKSHDSLADLKARIEAGEPAP